ncbi:hypothetical protein GCM10027570_09810 [Streptomonospora sediminis]
MPESGGLLLTASNRHAEPPAPRPTANDRGHEGCAAGSFDIEGKPVAWTASTTPIGASRNLFDSRGHPAPRIRKHSRTGNPAPLPHRRDLHRNAAAAQGPPAARRPGPGAPGAAVSDTPAQWRARRAATETAAPTGLVPGGVRRRPARYRTRRTRPLL